MIAREQDRHFHSYEPATLDNLPLEHFQELDIMDGRLVVLTSEIAAQRRERQLYAGNPRRRRSLEVQKPDKIRFINHTKKPLVEQFNMQNLVEAAEEMQLSPEDHLAYMANLLFMEGEFEPLTDRMKAVMKFLGIGHDALDQAIELAGDEVHTEEFDEYVGKVKTKIHREQAKSSRKKASSYNP